MRGQQRNSTGPERKPSSVLRFSTETLPPRDRVSYFQDVTARTVAGCNSSSLPGRDLRIDMELVAGTDLNLCRRYTSSLRNHRDTACLSDQDDDFVFFAMRGGSGRVEHKGHRIVLNAGDGLLARFSHPLDTLWPDAHITVLRVGQHLLRGVDADRGAGIKRDASGSLMRLLSGYLQVAADDGVANGSISPIAERHIAELIAGLCASNPDDAVARTREATAAARVVAMREILRRDYANPCLTMRHVAAAIGLSERAGHLAFEAAGLSFTEELRSIRLDRARDRLAAGTDRVLDIAYGVGFSDASHFHRLFKRRFECTPGELRAVSGED